MKILQMIPAFYPALAYGGTVAVAYHLSRELARRGHEVTVYTSDTLDKYSRQNDRYLEMNGIHVHYFRNLSNTLAWHRLVFTPSMLLQLGKELRNFDIIHLHGFRNFQNTPADHYAKKYNVPYVLQAHGSIPRIGKRFGKWLYDTLFGYRILRDASKVIALSQMEAQQYRRMGVPKEKIEIIPNGIDLSEYADLPPKGSFQKKFDIDDDEKIVLYLGRIHRTKGVDILVKAFASLSEKLIDVKLVIVGPDDGFLTQLEALIKALKIQDKVFISEPLYGKDKLEAYVDADVYVLPSRYEIFGITPIEAIACGTPVILTENCGIAEYFKDKVGMLVEPYTDHLSKALLEMLLDEDRQRAFRKNCKAVVEEFSISKIVSKLQKIYEEITDGG